METLLYHLTTVLSIAVLIVLIFGLRTLLKGENANLSQKLMRWRIGLQFLAILVVMAFAFMARS